MNNRQKLVQEQFLSNEEAVIKRLKQVYKKSLDDITSKAESLQKSIDDLGLMAKLSVDADEKAKLLSMQQSKIYQKQYQDALKKQVGSILDNMQVEEFKEVSAYLQKCYEDGFIGTMFDLHGQGIPLFFPLDQEAMVRAVQLDSKISEGLYTRLGEDVATLKKKITAQVSRGIASGVPFQQVAKSLSDYTNIGYNNAVRISRTEGHRIQVQSSMDAGYKAKDRGADVVKQWDSTLDSRTRESHQQVDGEIRELDEPFSNGLMFPGDPSGGAGEVVNCRCALLQRARWALDDAELETLKERAEFFGLDKNDSFEEFKGKYLKAVEEIEKDIEISEKSGIMEAEKLDISGFPAAFTKGAEKKNTQKMIDYVNNLEGANADTLKLYNSMGKMESIDSNGIPFKITHGKTHAVKYSMRYNGDLVEAQLTIPKLSGDNLAGQINTTLHENMHLIDMYCRTDPKKAGGWFSSSRKQLVDVFNDTSVDMSDEVADLFKGFKKEFDNVVESVRNSYKQQRADLRESYFPNGESIWSDLSKYKKYEKEAKKLDKWLDEEIDYQCRNIMGGGVNALQDIYDAISGGTFRDTGVVKYGHGSKYYRSVESRIHETMANYGALSVARPDLVEMLRKDKPELVSELESAIKAMIGKVGE